MAGGRSIVPYLGSQSTDYLYEYYHTTPWEEYSGLKLPELQRKDNYEDMS
jgi:hypothetical protein